MERPRAGISKERCHKREFVIPPNFHLYFVTASSQSPSEDQSAPSRAGPLFLAAPAPQSRVRALQTRLAPCLSPADIVPLSRSPVETLHHRTPSVIVLCCHLTLTKALGEVPVPAGGGISAIRSDEDPFWVLRVVSAMSPVSPLYPQEPTSSVRSAMSEKCQQATFAK
jgi:hypothetical protein